MNVCRDQLATLNAVSLACSVEHKTRRRSMYLHGGLLRTSSVIEMSMAGDSSNSMAHWKLPVSLVTNFVQTVACKGVLPSAYI